MTKYRKKPVVIEARGPITEEEYIETLEGRMHASVGDYIITGVGGEQYPCKPDVFAQTYEKVDAVDHKQQDSLNIYSTADVLAASSKTLKLIESDGRFGPSQWKNFARNTVYEMLNQLGIKL